MEVHAISNAHLSIESLSNIIQNKIKIELSPEAIVRIENCRKYLDEKMKGSELPVYGINTGFGSLYNVKIDATQVEQLQKNLVMSHACGMGEEVPANIVELMLFLKIQSLSYGNSGVQLSTVQRLVDYFNNKVCPIVYTKGSLGASGDLAPLAHMCLPMIGLGEVMFQGNRMSGKELNEKMGWEEIHFQSKEGLALLNGTQFMSAYAVDALIRSKKILDQAELISAISLEGYDGRVDAFDSLIHNARGQEGQVEVAQNMLKILDGSEIAKQKKEHVQDPYSFRCIPQVHGASRDTYKYVHQIITREINAVTDNPNIFPEEDKIISGGNFHGQPLALAMDFLAIAIAEIGNISERRTYQLISGLRNLPAFLVENPGLNSGYMIPQYTAASIVSENKQLCTPASVDSIVSSNGQEDHVSMGANAATKLWRVLNNVEMILGIEIMNAVQAIEFRRPLKSSSIIEKTIADFRKIVGRNSEDRYLSTDMRNSTEYLKNRVN